MNITHLLCFVTVCEAGTIQNAAKELYVTPSAISQNIKMMERELDSLLFVRTTRKMELTEQGRVLYRYAKQILTLYQDALHELNM